MMDASVDETRVEPRTRWAKLALVVLVVFYALNQMWWGLVVPLGQSPDETGHVGYVEFLLEEGILPSIDTAMVPPILQRIQFSTVPGGADRRLVFDYRDPRWGFFEDELRGLLDEPHTVTLPRRRNHEVGQPPLAYLLAALATIPFDRHTNPMERWQLYRLMNMVGGAGAIVAAWFLGAWLWPRAPDRGGLLLAAAATGLPMATFVRSVASNDALLITLGSMVFVLCVTWRAATIPRGMAIGLAVGLALVTKASALALLPLMLVWGLWHGGHRRDALAALVAGGTLATLIFFWYHQVAVRSDSFLYLSFADITFRPLWRPLEPEAAWLIALTDTFTALPVGFFGQYGALEIQRPAASQMLTFGLLAGGVIGFFLPQVVARGRLLRLEDLRWQRAVLLALVPTLTFLLMMLVSGTGYAEVYGFSTLQGRFVLFLMLPVFVLVLAGWRRLAGWLLARLSVTNERVRFGVSDALVVSFALILLVMNRHDLFTLVAGEYFEADLPILLLSDYSGRFFQLVCINLPEALKLPGMWRALYYTHAVVLTVLVGVLMVSVADSGPGKRLMGVIGLFAGLMIHIVLVH